MNNTSNGLLLPYSRVKMQLGHRLFNGIASSFELELETVPEMNYGHYHRLQSLFSCQPLSYIYKTVTIIIIFKVNMHFFPICNCIQVIS